MGNPEFHTCTTCGHVWKHGVHGGHDCKGRLVEQNNELIAQVELFKNQLSYFVSDHFEFNEGSEDTRDGIQELLDKSPVQCLNQVKADAITSMNLDSKILDWVEEHFEEIYALQEHEKGEQLHITYSLGKNNTKHSQGDNLRSIVSSIMGNK